MTDENTEYTGAWTVWNDEGLDAHISHEPSMHMNSMHHHQFHQPHQQHQLQQVYRTILNPMNASQGRMTSDNFAGTMEENYGGQSYYEQGQLPNMHHIHMGGSKKKIRKNFDYRLREILDFKRKYGHLNIPHKYDENPSLGTWVDTMRRKYRKLVKSRKEGSLLNCKSIKSIMTLEEEIEKLSSIGFELEPRSGRDGVWENRIEQLARFKEEHGHCNVKEDDTTYPGLGKWVSYLRRSLRLAKTGRRAIGRRLSEERIAILKELGFVFELKEELLIKRFRDGFNDLKAFYSKHGHCKVPKFYDVSPTMGLCIEDMRKEYRRICRNIGGGNEASSVCMSSEMIYELASMGFLADEGCYPFNAPIHDADDARVSSLSIETLDETLEDIIHAPPIELHQTNSHDEVEDAK